MKTTLSAELKKARKNRYAVPAFNFDNLEMLKAIIEACEEEKSPVIIMVTESAAKYMGIDYVKSIGKEVVETATVPVVFHWDHGHDLELIKKAIDDGYTSVMLDDSLLSIEENIENTKKIVEYAHKNNVEVEAEIGHVGGKEDDNESFSDRFTSVEEAKKFWEQTNVDALAIAVGTAHGVYNEPVKLQIDLIREIAYCLEDIPLVLHGSSGVPDDQLHDAIEAGIAKVNIGTDLKLANALAIKKWFEANPEEYDARKFGRFAIDAIKKVIKDKIRAVGSKNKAMNEDQ